MPVEGKVAAILNERDLVINKGSEDGVAEGMKFRVTEPELSLKDPDTGECLGSLAREKIRIRIVEVQPRFSIGKTYETYVVNVGGTAASMIFAALGQSVPRQEVTRVRTLRLDNSITLAPMNEEDSFVKVGDPVVQVEAGI